jgi:hypothetical protein
MNLARARGVRRGQGTATRRRGLGRDRCSGSARRSGRQEQSRHRDARTRAEVRAVQRLGGALGGANAPAVDADVGQRRVGARGEDGVEVVAALCGGDEARKARGGRALRRSHASRAARRSRARSLRRRTRQLRESHTEAGTGARCQVSPPADFARAFRFSAVGRRSRLFVRSVRTMQHRSALRLLRGVFAWPQVRDTRPHAATCDQACAVRCVLTPHRVTDGLRAASSSTASTRRVLGAPRTRDAVCAAGAPERRCPNCLGTPAVPRSLSHGTSPLAGHTARCVTAQRSTPGAAAAA